MVPSVLLGFYRLLYLGQIGPSLGIEHIPYGAGKDRMYRQTEIYSRNIQQGSQRSSFGVDLSELFPFGVNNGDSKVPTGDDNFSEVELKDGDSFIFFNSSYDTLWVNTNGPLSFARGIREYYPDCQGALRTPLITSFWADIDTRKGGSVWYRKTKDSAILEKAAKDIRKGFPNGPVLNPKWAFVATWDNVAFFNSVPSRPGCPGDSLRNTFQTVLLQDELESFVLFYYNKIQWVSRHDSCTGTGGIAAKAGFNYGDGENLYMLPTSCTTDMINIPETTNFNQEGKWAFKVTQTVVDTCEVRCEEGREYHANPYECKTYYFCTDGVPDLRSCAPGTLFSPFHHTCVHPWMSDCEPICTR